MPLTSALPATNNILVHAMHSAVTIAVGPSIHSIANIQAGQWFWPGHLPSGCVLFGFLIVTDIEIVVIVMCQNMHSHSCCVRVHLQFQVNKAIYSMNESTKHLMAHTCRLCPDRDAMLPTVPGTSRVRSSSSAHTQSLRCRRFQWMPHLWERPSGPLHVRSHPRSRWAHLH